MQKFKKVLYGLGVLIAVIVLANVSLWLTGHSELAIAILVGIAVLVSFVAASAWSALLLRAGAEIAVRSQESDDKRDIAQIKAATDLAKVLMQQEESQPALPMPQQQSWLPELSEFAEGEFEEVAHD